MNRGRFEAIATLAKDESLDPATLLARCSQLERFNSARLRWMVLIGPACAGAGFSIVRAIAGSFRLSPPLQAAALAVASFVPPFVLYAFAMGASERPLSRASNPWFGGFVLAAITFLMPVAVAFIAMIGLILIGGPILLIIRWITGHALQSMPVWYEGIFAVPALAISFAYVLSPNRRFSSPFPLKVLFGDALIALVLGWRRVLAVAAGFAMWKTVDALLRQGFVAETLIYGVVGGVLAGIQLTGFEIDSQLQSEVALARSRLHQRLGQIFRARYWAGDAWGRLDGDVPEERAAEVMDLARSLGLKP